MENRKRLLIVDDHPVNRTVVSLHVRGTEWDPVQASSGFEALDLLAAETFDCVLLDMSMPGMSGQEVCQRIRADERLRDVHVIGYTAHAMSSEQQQILAAGFDDLLIKPITQGDLIKALNASRG